MPKVAYFIPPESPMATISRDFIPAGWDVTMMDASVATEQEQIDLVLLDLSMPKMSGQEVLAGIRAISMNTDVIILTGHFANAGEFPGVRQVIKKPFRSQELLGSIRAVLDTPIS